MWLINSSVGKKVVMSVTGICLILFLTFHSCMNAVALISSEGYNAVCEFLGTNWYALVGTLGLAALAVFHFIYAFLLTLQNRKARGPQRYSVTLKPDEVEWASQNMFVLGLIIVLGLLLHLFNFWYNMMFSELIGRIGLHAPADGYAYIADTFSNPVFSILYVVWLVAIWFHLSHGFWSSLQTLGLNGKLWLKRWKMIGIIWVTIVVAVLLLIVVKFSFCGGAC